MFRVVIDSVADFKRLLAVKDSSTLTFRIKEKKLTLLVASSELVVMYSVKTPVDCENMSFAIKREVLNHLYKAGNFAVDVSDDTVTIYFYDTDNNVTHDACFTRLQDIESIYFDMLNTLQAGKGVEIPVKDLTALARLAVSQQASLQVKGKLACVILASNLKVFKPMDIKADFCVRPTYLKYLLNNSSVWYKVKQYLCAKCDNLTFFCATDRLSDCDGEYAMVHGGYKLAVKMRMLLKLQPLRELAASHLYFESMAVDLDRHLLKVQGSTPCNYYLDISDMKCTKDFKKDDLKLPKRFLDILGIFGEQVMLTHRKSFIAVTDANGMEVYFS